MAGRSKWSRSVDQLVKSKKTLPVVWQLVVQPSLCGPTRELARAMVGCARAPRPKLSSMLIKILDVHQLVLGQMLVFFDHSLCHCFFIKTNYIVTFLTFFCASTNTIPNARECSFITFLVISKKKIKAGYINLLIHKLLWNNKKNRQNDTPMKKLNEQTCPLNNSFLSIHK